MKTDSELYEMGWNDLLGTIKLAPDVTVVEVTEFANKVLAGKIRLAMSAEQYKSGACAAAQKLLDGEEIDFVGPDWVREYLRKKVADALVDDDA
jgi:hypothetical protein